MRLHFQEYQMNTNRQFKPGLFWWQLRQVMPVNLVVCCAAVLYAMFAMEPIVPPGDPLHFCIIVVHSAIVVLLLGRSSTRRAGFLYAQGYSRDQMWFQSLVVSVVSAAVVCGPVWLIIVSGLRFWIQDTVLTSPHFLMIGPAEYSMPAVYFVEYLIAMLLMHYGWIRAAQNTPETAAGWYLMVLGIGFLFWGRELAFYHRQSSQGLLLLFLALLSIVGLLLLACGRAHRSAEVQS